jgi:thioredoxin reductase (NADPH)
MYDVLIIGGGPAGLSAAIQAKRYNLNTITVASDIGGKIKNAHNIENWPGDFAISGNELTNKIINHTKEINANLVEDEVKAVRSDRGSFSVTTDGKQYTTKRILLTVGNERVRLNIPGEEDFFKKGVSYNANIEGELCINKTVAVVGSGDSACTSALFLADIAKKVYLMYRSKNLKAEPIWIEKVKKHPRIELLSDTMPVSILGDKVVKQLECDNGKKLDIDGVFIEIGFNPSNGLVDSLGLKTDTDGFVVVDSEQKTSKDNVWAAGDITTNSGKLRQIITAASEGMVALNSIYNDINK